jgi:phosphoglycerol transferase MdoB-like AlkP superfamily enzyme
MESAGDIFEKVMPRLRRLKKEGIDFSACYGNTWRTDRGTVCTYSGFPSFPTSSVMKMPKKTNHLPGIAKTLRKTGYQTSYLYGGDINFTNMRSFLITTGWEKLTWKADYSQEEQSSAKWGVRDDITFNTLYEQIAAIDTAANHQRHLFGFSTLSSHEPWDVPLKKLDQPIPNAFYYLDVCIGNFIDKLKQLPQWDNLLIIFLPDHSIDYGNYSEALQARNKIPMVWAGGAVKAPRKITKLCNQTDLAATLLAQLRLPHDQYRWSRDVLSASYRYPFAVHNYNNGFSLTDSTGFIAYDLNSHRLVTNESSQATRLERMGKAILQATTADLKTIGTK